MAVILLVILLASIAIGVPGYLIYQESSKRRRHKRGAERRKKNIAWEKAWHFVFGGNRHRRLTDQRNDRP